MALQKFEWDEFKNNINQKKHGISFREAAAVFFDPNAIVYVDPDHSYIEERFLIIGTDLKERILIVSHCYRNSDNTIRLISARKATVKERKIYETRF